MLGPTLGTATTAPPPSLSLPPLPSAPPQAPAAGGMPPIPSHPAMGAAPAMPTMPPLPTMPGAGAPPSLPTPTLPVFGGGIPAPIASNPVPPLPQLPTQPVQQVAAPAMPTMPPAAQVPAGAAPAPAEAPKKKRQTKAEKLALEAAAAAKSASMTPDPNIPIATPHLASVGDPRDPNLNAVIPSPGKIAAAMTPTAPLPPPPTVHVAAPVQAQPVQPTQTINGVPVSDEVWHDDEVFDDQLEGTTTHEDAADSLPAPAETKQVAQPFPTPTDAKQSGTVGDNASQVHVVVSFESIANSGAVIGDAQDLDRMIAAVVDNYASQYGFAAAVNPNAWNPKDPVQKAIHLARWEPHVLNAMPIDELNAMKCAVSAQIISVESMANRMRDTAQRMGSQHGDVMDAMVAKLSSDAKVKDKKQAILEAHPEMRRYLNQYRLAQALAEQFANMSKWFEGLSHSFNRMIDEKREERQRAGFARV